MIRIRFVALVLVVASAALAACGTSDPAGDLGEAPDAGDDTDLAADLAAVVTPDGGACASSSDCPAGHSCVTVVFGEIPTNECVPDPMDLAGLEEAPLDLATADGAMVPVVPVPNLPVARVAAGGYHTCAVLSDGAVACWGQNGSGQLGNGLATGSKVPVGVPYLDAPAMDVVAGYNHSCALLTTGGVKCWGSAARGQVGDGTVGDGTYKRRTPVSVIGLPEAATAIAAGADHTCARLVSGAVRCWGDNTRGALGDGSTITRTSAVAVVGLPEAATGLGGGDGYSCAVLASGALSCWGENFQYALGNSGMSTTQPVAVALPGPAKQVDGSTYATCAVLTTGALYCWGGNPNGQVADGTMLPRATPTLASQLSPDTAQSVSAGTCVVTGGGAVRCWAFYSTVGQVALAGPAVQVSVAIGSGHVCALLATGGVRCWGNNTYGQLGNGTNMYSTTPVAVSGLP